MRPRTNELNWSRGGRDSPSLDRVKKIAGVALSYFATSDAERRSNTVWTPRADNSSTPLRVRRASSPERNKTRSRILGVVFPFPDVDGEVGVGVDVEEGDERNGDVEVEDVEKEDEAIEAESP